MTNMEFSTHWHERHVPVWTEMLAQLKGLPHLHFLEVGCFEGRSTCWLLEHILTHSTSKITCVDPLYDELNFIDPSTKRRVHVFDLYDRFTRNIEQSGRKESVHLIREQSQIALRKLPFRSFDCVYIDGDHHPKEVFIDIALSWGLLKIGGMLILDDYKADALHGEAADVSPREAIDAFMNCFQGHYTLVHKEYQVFVIKHPPSVLERYSNQKNQSEASDE